MIKVYAVTLVTGMVLLIAWILFFSHAENESKPGLDPEARFGLTGRRVVAGMVGFGMAGMSAEFSPKNISWPLALILALAGAGVSIWWAGVSFNQSPDPEV